MTAPKYAAFISYKHSARSRTIAVALEKELRRYARPWYKKPIKIFRDESSMSAGISLPDLIRKGLKDSTYLIYLAEREAASSPWIVDELLIWNRDLKRTDKLIIVHVSDAISFTNTAGKLVLDWVSSTALPSVLQDYLVDIPLYIEMSWAVKQEDLDIHNPKFKNVVNTITACIRGIEPDDLTGEENLVYRRNKRIRNIALTVFVVLFVISAALGMLFYRSSINEQQNRMLAEQQRDISSRMAISGQKVIQALDVEPVDPTESLILLKQAQTIYNDVNVESNLYKIFFRNNLYSRYHPQSLAYKEYILQTAPSVVLSNALTGVTKTLDIPEPYAFRISKDGKWMAHEGKKALQILELSTGRNFSYHLSENTTDFCFLNTSNVLLCLNEDVLKWIDPQKGVIDSLNTGQLRPDVVKVSPDDSYIAVGSFCGDDVFECDSTIKIFDRNKRLVKSFHGDYPMAFAFGKQPGDFYFASAPDSFEPFDITASPCDLSVYNYQINAKTQKLLFNTKSDLVADISVSEDGELIAIGTRGYIERSPEISQVFVINRSGKLLNTLQADKGVTRRIYFITKDHDMLVETINGVIRWNNLFITPRRITLNDNCTKLLFYPGTHKLMIQDEKSINSYEPESMSFKKIKSTKKFPEQLVDGGDFCYWEQDSVLYFLNIHTGVQDSIITRQFLNQNNFFHINKKTFFVEEESSDDSLYKYVIHDLGNPLSKKTVVVPLSRKQHLYLTELNEELYIHVGQSGKDEHPRHGPLLIPLADPAHRLQLEMYPDSLAPDFSAALLTPDKKYLFLLIGVADDPAPTGTVMTYDFNTRKLINRNPLDRGYIRSAFFLPGHEKFVAVTDPSGWVGKEIKNESMINIFNAKGEKIYKHYYSNLSDAISHEDHIAFSDDNKFMAVANGKNVFVYYTPEYFLSNILDN